jgi:hypothetical protein
MLYLPMHLLRLLSTRPQERKSRTKRLWIAVTAELNPLGPPNLPDHESQSASFLFQIWLCLNLGHLQKFHA